MTVSSIVVMVIGIVVIWGGLAASIMHAVMSSKKNKSKNVANNV